MHTHTQNAVISTISCMTKWRQLAVSLMFYLLIFVTVLSSLSLSLSRYLSSFPHLCSKKSSDSSSFVSFSQFFMVQFFFKEDFNSSPLTIAMLPWKQRDEIETYVFFLLPGRSRWKTMWRKTSVCSGGVSITDKLILESSHQRCTY